MRKNLSKFLSVCFCVLLTLSSVNLKVTAASTASIPQQTIVTVVSAGYNSLNVSWNETSSAAGYQVYRATSAAGTYYMLGETTSLSYLNTGLSFNTSYYYKVQPFFIIDTIKVPGVMSAYGTAKTALSPLSSVVVESYGYNTIRLAWGAVLGASGYEVWRSIGTSSTYSLIKTTTLISFLNTSLTTNTLYNYKIRSYRLVGTTKVYSAYTSVYSVRPIPSAPTNLAVVSTGYNSLRVTWNAVSGASGYEVSTSLSETGPFALLPLTTSNIVNLTNQSTNVAVYVKVRAYRTVGSTKIYGPSTIVVHGTPIPATPAVSIVSLGYNSLRLSWAAIPGVSGYDLYKYNPSNSTYELLSNQTALTYTDGSLVTGVNQSYKVIAYRMVDALKVESNPSSIVTLKPVPSAVSNFKIDMPGITFINLSWNAVTGATGYEISRSTTSTGTYVLISTLSATSFSNTGLTFNRTYYYKIRSYTTVGSTKVYGSTSAAISAKTVPSTMTLTLTNLDSRTNRLSWAAISGATAYQIYYSKGTSTYYTLLTTTTSTSYTHNSLTRGVKYNYKIRAYKLSGTTKIYGAYSSVQSVWVQYSANELLSAVSLQLNTVLANISVQAEKDIVVKVKAAIDARRLDSNYDYVSKANEAKVMFSKLTTNQKTHLMLTIIVYVNTEYLLRLNELLPVY